MKQPIKSDFVIYIPQKQYLDPLLSIQFCFILEDGSKAVCFKLITWLAPFFCYTHRHNGRYYLQKREQIVRLTSKAAVSSTYGNVTKVKDRSLIILNYKL